MTRYTVMLYTGLGKATDQYHTDSQDDAFSHFVAWVQQSIDRCDCYCHIVVVDNDGAYPHFVADYFKR